LHWPSRDDGRDLAHEDPRDTGLRSTGLRATPWMGGREDKVWHCATTCLELNKENGRKGPRD
jgi:hypothetical protein